jgi:hypothetical protein
MVKVSLVSPRDGLLCSDELPGGPILAQEAIPLCRCKVTLFAVEKSGQTRIFLAIKDKGSNGMDGKAKGVHGHTPIW